MTYCAFNSYLSLHTSQVQDTTQKRSHTSVKKSASFLLSSCSPSCLRHHHGPLSEGAVPQLHDRLNHRAADVAAGENLPGLNRGATRKRRWTRGGGGGGSPAWLLLIDSCAGSVYIFSFSLHSLVWSRALVFQVRSKTCVCHSQVSTMSMTNESGICICVLRCFLNEAPEFWREPRGNSEDGRANKWN